MKLDEYIKKNYRTPNPAVLRSLGANEKLISYLLHTEWNTNINMIGSISTNMGAVVGKAIVGKDKVS